MPKRIISRRKARKVRPVTKHDYIPQLVSGSSILKTEITRNSLKFELSSGLTLSALAEDIDISVLGSPVSPAHIPSARICLLARSEESVLGLVEMRLSLVRQIYAILVLIEEDRSKDAAGLLKSQPDDDLESLLNADERLLIIGAGQGSFVVDLASKAYDKIKKTPHAALNAISLIFAEGRTLILRNVKAGTRIKEAEAAMKEAEVQKYRLDAMIDAIKKIDEIQDAEVRKILRDAFIDDLKKALGADGESQLKLLPESS